MNEIMSHLKVFLMILALLMTLAGCMKSESTQEKEKRVLRLFGQVLGKLDGDASACQGANSGKANAGKVIEFNLNHPTEDQLAETIRIILINENMLLKEKDISDNLMKSARGISARCSKYLLTVVPSENPDISTIKEIRMNGNIRLRLRFLTSG